MGCRDALAARPIVINPPQSFLHKEVWCCCRDAWQCVLRGHCHPERVWRREGSHLRSHQRWGDPSWSLPRSTAGLRMTRLLWIAWVGNDDSVMIIWFLDMVKPPQRTDVPCAHRISWRNAAGADFTGWTSDLEFVEPLLIVSSNYFFDQGG